MATSINTFSQKKKLENKLMLMFVLMSKITFHFDTHTDCRAFRFLLEANLKE